MFLLRLILKLYLIIISKCIKAGSVPCWKSYLFRRPYNYYFQNQPPEDYQSFYMAQYLLIDRILNRILTCQQKKIIVYSYYSRFSCSGPASNSFMNPLTITDATPAAHLDSKHSLESSSALRMSAEQPKSVLCAKR